MIQSHSPSTIATAPEIPSSSSMAYYDPRSSNYYQQVNSTPNQQMYMSQSTHSSAAAAAAAAAAAGLSSTSLPPLSQLLPPPAVPVESNPAITSVSQSQAVVSTKVDHQHQHQQQQHQHQQQQQQQHNPMNVSSHAPDYFNSQAPMPERTNRSMSAAHEMSYRKSIDGQRPVYPPTVANDLPRRNYISTHESPDNYYLLQQQQHHHNSQETASIPQYPPQHHPNTAVVPSSDLSMFPSPHPALSQYHRTQTHYHLPSPPTSVIDGVLMTDPHSMQGGINANNQKVFSFVPLPGLNQKKRPRRKYHEVERLYRCNYQDCNKSYGTLNHLNAHVSMQRHGPKRQPAEFKELRKMWRKQKRENKQRNVAAAAAAAAAAANGGCSPVDSVGEAQHLSDDDLIQKNDLCDYSMQHYQPSLLSHHSSPWHHPSSQPGYMPTY